MPKTKILIVDDEPIFAFSLKRMLIRSDYEVTATADSYQTAIENFRLNKPDLIIMDINLRGMQDGIDTMHAIQMLEKIPVIFVSSSVNPETIKRAEQIENCSFLAKPDTDNFIGILEKEITDLLKIMVTEENYYV